MSLVIGAPDALAAQQVHVVAPGPVLTVLLFDSTVNHLPEYSECAEPDFHWDSLSGEECYDEIVHWCRNLSKIHSGKAGKGFVWELSRPAKYEGLGTRLTCMLMVLL